MKAPLLLALLVASPAAAQNPRAALVAPVLPTAVLAPGLQAAALAASPARPAAPGRSGPADDVIPRLTPALALPVLPAATPAAAAQATMAAVQESAAPALQALSQPNVRAPPPTAPGCRWRTP